MAERARFVRTDRPVQEAATKLTHAVRATHEARGSVRLAIPGGSALAALRPARERLGPLWDEVRLTWVDERCVPVADPASNRGTAFRSGALDPAHPPALTLPLLCDGESEADALARIEARLAADFEAGLDVLLLGMGEDGHVASLFPDFGSPADALAAVVAQSPKPPPRRITLTPRLLTTARRSVLLATGASKREALARLARRDPSLAASALDGLVVVTDQAEETG